MLPPQWKILLSYLFEFHIESAPSELNPHLYVSLRNGRYQLCTANAVYSYGDLYDNFSKAFKKLKLEEIGVKNVLLLGLGLGSVPLILEKSFGQDYHYTAVEIDESVIYLANKYGLTELQSSIEVICTDALNYVRQSEQQFDMICMDVFLDDLIPKDFESAAFLKDLKRLLSPNGILLYNRLALIEKDKVNAKLFYEFSFKPVFSESTYLDVGGNWMLLNRSDYLKND